MLNRKKFEYEIPAGCWSNIEQPTMAVLLLGWNNSCIIRHFIARTKAALRLALYLYVE